MMLSVDRGSPLSNGSGMNETGLEQALRAHAARGGGPDVHGLTSDALCHLFFNLWPHRERLMVSPLKKNIMDLGCTDGPA